MPFLKNKKQLLQHKAWRRPRVEGRIAPQEASNLGSEASAGGRGCLQTQTLVPQKGRLAAPSHTHSRVLRWRVASELPSRCGGQGLALQTPDTQALRLPVPIRGRDPPTLSLQDGAPGRPVGGPGWWASTSTLVLSLHSSLAGAGFCHGPPQHQGHNLPS